MVFTDLDGTLLDHDSYSHAPARPALEALAALEIPLILASSKTAREIAPLHAELALAPCPIIAENGAQMVTPGTEAAEDRSAYRKIRAALERMPAELRSCFTGFGDMDRQGVIEATGLDPQSAGLAQARCHSEPGLWSGTEEGFARFADLLGQEGISSRRGGRFATLSFGATKADRMRELIAAHAPDHTIALGDAPNDIEMIETASHGVIVRNTHGPGLPPLDGERAGTVRRTQAPGPQGWNEAVLDILEELELHRRAD
ncbi:HAD-IIB family hydrolase [Poseidonocella sedimentorum]